MNQILRTFAGDRLLHLLLLAGLLLSPFARFRLTELPIAVDWKTIFTLGGLLLTKGIETSGYFDVVGHRLIVRFRHQRTLALFLVFASMLLATFLTNDVALFIIIPLTLSLQKFTTLPLSRLIIFEALAVNTSSLLTPIGNPQNILLWSKSDMGFITFIWQMLPLSILLITILAMLTVFSFRSQKVEIKGYDAVPLWQRGLLLKCAVLYLLFLVALELDLALPALVLIVLLFLVRLRHIVLAVDWSLLAVFIMMFVDLFLLTRLPGAEQLLNQTSGLGKGGHYLLAIALSQFISNVPATILLKSTLPVSTLLMWAVNIGGFGLLPGSLANIIALRMARDRYIWWQFHLFSLPTLLVAAVGGWWLLTLLHTV